MSQKCTLAGSKRKSDVLEERWRSANTGLATLDLLEERSANILENQFDKLTLPQLSLIIECWRPSSGVQPESAGTMLGNLLADDPALGRIIRERTNQLENSYVINEAIPLIGAYVATLFPEHVPRVLTGQEFLRFCDGVVKGCPMYRNIGMPGDLWFQLLMHTSLQIVPWTHQEDKHFPMPRNVFVGEQGISGSRSCLYLHAQGYFYRKIVETIGRNWTERNAARLLGDNIKILIDFVKSQSVSLQTVLCKELVKLIFGYLYGF